MPYYDYKCPSCEKIEERKHEINNYHFEVCYDCSENRGEPVTMNKVYTVPSVIFKGNGFYLTDNRKKMPH
jgi:predicted nucleic acid-binding Zn ribbon protein